jgi:hypothetical protein
MEFNRNAFNDAIVNALCKLADELAAAATFRDGFALLKVREPVGLEASLESTWKQFGDEAWDAFDSVTDPGLETHELIYMGWNGAPGVSSEMIYSVVRLLSERRIYMQDGDDVYGPTIVSVSDKKWKPLVDIKFPRYLFRNELNEFIGNSPPTDVASCIRSFPFLIDLFITAFEGSEFWTKLSQDGLPYNEEYSALWNDEYENPKDPRGVPGMQKNAYQKIINDEINSMRLGRRLYKRSTQDPDAKTQIVGRYLARALRAGLYWRPLDEGKDSENGAPENIRQEESCKKEGKYIEE